MGTGAFVTYARAGIKLAAKRSALPANVLIEFMIYFAATYHALDALQQELFSASFAPNVASRAKGPLGALPALLGAPASLPAQAQSRNAQQGCGRSQAYPILGIVGSGMTFYYSG